MIIRSRLEVSDDPYLRYCEGVKETADLVLKTVEQLRNAAIRTMGEDDGSTVLVTLEAIEAVIMNHNFKDE